MKVELLMILIYMVSMVLLGYYIQKRGASNSASSYLVADNGVGPVLLGGTIFATNWGGGILLGSAGAAFTGYLIATVADPWTLGLTMIIEVLFFVAVLRKLKIASLTEMYRLRFGKYGAAVASVLSIPTMIFWTAVQILALAKIFDVFLGLPPMTCAALAGLIVVAYTYLGGMLAVIWTDNIQMVITFAGMIILIPAAIRYVGGIDVILANTPEHFWSILPHDAGDSGLDRTPLGILTWIASWCGMGLGYLASLDLTQRILCARSDKDAKRGLIIGTGLYWTAGTIAIFFGLIGIVLVSLGFTTPSGALYADVLAGDPELLIPLLANVLFSPEKMGAAGSVLTGVFIGALLAAIMSTASSTIFAAATSLSTLFVHGSVAAHSDDSAKVLKLTRMLVLAVGVFCIGISFITNSVYGLMVFGFTIMFACLFWVTVCTLFWKKCNAYGSIASMLGGFFTVVAGLIAMSIQYGKPLIEPVDNIWFCFFTFVPWIVSGVLMFAVTLLTQKINPPVCLCDTEGNIVKWADLPRSDESEKVYELSLARRKNT